ncbi:MAG TPA: thiamine pyrophosphate-dependent enzyme, partial [Candidatus Limnocylindrales bacterium]|nr:thiamine pyrophosphate-dependent enzyme [Candidatus Limnocylindrales bacterium]
LHEAIAVAMAHGYVKASGRPMAVGLHDTVGLLNGSMAIFNAWVDRAPMLLVVGTGPMDAAHRRPWLDWIHTVGEQGELVRHLTVWNEQPSSLEALLSGTTRAWRASRTGAGGPALIGFDISLQEAAADAPPADGALALRLDVPRIGPDPAAIEELAAALRGASRPVFVTDRPLSAAASASLVGLAERLGAGLVELGGGASFAVGHPNDLTEASADAIRSADHVTFVEVRDPAFALGPVDLATRRTDGPDRLAPTASIGLGNLRDRSWMVTDSAGPERLEIIADAELALAALDDTLAGARRDLDPAFVALRARPDPVPPDSPVAARGIHRAHLGRALAAALDGHDWVLAHGQLGGWARRILRFRPGQFLGRSGGEGLGYGPGATVGAALALRGSGTIVVGLQGDGDLLYAPQALWTAAAEGLPLLMVIDNNRTYGKDEQHQRVLAKERGRPEANVLRGIAIDGPAVDLTGLARSLGVAAEGPITDFVDLAPALARAVERVRAGEPAVVEVRTHPSDR